MATVVLACSVTGQLDKEDRLAMLRTIEVENARRAGLNPPIPALPISTNPEIRTSYASIYTARLVAAHLTNVEEAVEASNQTSKQKQLRRLAATATQAQLDAAIAALNV